jgi:hypothetical protein
MHRDRVGRILARVEVGQLLRTEPHAAAQPPPHRHRRDAEHLGGLPLRHPLDAHQVEDFLFVLRQLVDRAEHAEAVRAEPGTTGDRRRHELLAQLHGGGLIF